MTSRGALSMKSVVINSSYLVHKDELCVNVDRLGYDLMGSELMGLDVNRLVCTTDGIPLVCFENDNNWFVRIADAIDLLIKDSRVENIELNERSFRLRTAQEFIRQRNDFHEKGVIPSGFSNEWVWDFERYWQDNSRHSRRNTYLRKIHKAWPELFDVSQSAKSRKARWVRASRSRESPAGGYVY